VRNALCLFHFMPDPSIVRLHKTFLRNVNNDFPFDSTHKMSLRDNEISSIIDVYSRKAGCGLSAFIKNIYSEAPEHSVIRGTSGGSLRCVFCGTQEGAGFFALLLTNFVPN